MYNQPNMQTETITQSFVHPDTEGYYGSFGGAYIPEMLYRNVSELREQYLNIIHSADFRKEMENDEKTLKLE